MYFITFHIQFHIHFPYFTYSLTTNTAFFTISNAKNVAADAGAVFTTAGTTPL